MILVSQVSILPAVSEKSDSAILVASFLSNEGVAMTAGGRCHCERSEAISVGGGG